jgi:hypothetical protein
MQYALLIYVKPGADDGLSDAEQHAVSQEYLEIRKDPRVVGGAHLEPVQTATTVRVAGGETLVTDGPFADTKEVFGGYYLLEADDLDAAIEIAARVPAARMGGSVEIRPMVEHPQ